METSHQPAIDHRPTTGIWSWIAFAFGSLVISLPADLFISLVHSEPCSQPAYPPSVLHGRVAMLIVLLVVALPWMIAIPMSRDRGRGAAIGLVALLPALAFLLHGLTAGAWSTELCLGG